MESHNVKREGYGRVFSESLMQNSHEMKVRYAYCVVLNEAT